MTSDPLYDPLGVAMPRPRRRLGASLRWAGLVMAGLLTLATGLAIRQAHQRAERGVAVAAIELAPKAAVPAVAPVAPATARPPFAEEAAPLNGDTVEIQNGVKIIRLGAAASSKSIAIPVTDTSVTRLKPAPDPRLVETTRFGGLPRIGANGLRPAEAYARPVGLGAHERSGAPRLALLVGSMGIDQLATAQASRRLPPAVTLGVPPDGPDLITQVGEMRQAGHEVLLQLAGDPDASSSTVSTAGAPGSLDHLHWMMGRFPGYPGVAFVGGGDGPAAFGTEAVLRDIVARGLFVVGNPAQPTDAMSGSQAVAPDVVIDAAEDQTAVASALDRLETAARANGTAVGVVSTMQNLDAVTRFAAGLEAKGITLVPVSALTGAAHEPKRASR